MPARPLSPVRQFSGTPTGSVVSNPNAVRKFRILFLFPFNLQS
jgi:hypothetical protein